MKKIKMKKRFGFIGTLMVAIFALTGVAHADGHLKFPIGEGGFSWDSYHAFAKKHDYTGQQLTMTTRVTGSGEVLINNMMAYFNEATGAKANTSARRPTSKMWWLTSKEEHHRKSPESSCQVLARTWPGAVSLPLFVKIRTTARSPTGFATTTPLAIPGLT